MSIDDPHPAARRRRGGQHRAQEPLQVGRARRLGGEAEAVAFAQDRDRRFGRAEQHDLVVARLPAERRDAPALPFRQAMGGARQRRAWASAAPRSSAETMIAARRPNGGRPPRRRSSVSSR